jgi:hypothetical protein
MLCLPLNHDWISEYCFEHNVGNTDVVMSGFYASCESTQPDATAMSGQTRGGDIAFWSRFSECTASVKPEMKACSELERRVS